MLFKLSFVPCGYLLTIALFKHLEMRFQQFSITCTLNQRCSLSRTALSHPLLYEYIKSLCKITKIAKQFFAKISQNKSELENLVHLFFTILSKNYFKNVQQNDCSVLWPLLYVFTNRRYQFFKQSTLRRVNCCSHAITYGLNYVR